ncbi:hypothetical protein [Chryseobacterium sp. SIMBA_028]|uniref:hypothetical protein n=1 Tax=Chryseobacterium sp. SIMBA_028 TaxID=3085771 RepID=UPI00397B5F14
MDYTFYLKEFNSVIEIIPKEEFERCNLEVAIEVVLESAALKVYNPEWSGDPLSPLDATGRIFFSIWINEQSIKERKVYYNIHALKVRTLTNYSISSRKFAQDFRSEFLKYQKDWPNVSVDCGPLTLMQGWVDLKVEKLQKNVFELVQNFLKISFTIDRVLALYKKDNI